MTVKGHGGIVTLFERKAREFCVSNIFKRRQLPKKSDRGRAAPSLSLHHSQALPAAPMKLESPAPRAGAETGLGLHHCRAALTAPNLKAAPPKIKRQLRLQLRVKASGGTRCGRLLALSSFSRRCLPGKPKPPLISIIFLPIRSCCIVLCATWPAKPSALPECRVRPGCEIPAISAGADASPRDLPHPHWPGFAPPRWPGFLRR
jgi:hypothetical protein